MMKQQSAGGGVVAVDTCKFESWPLLRPDELSSLPTEVLRASVADLEVMCRQASGKEEEGIRRRLSFGWDLFFVQLTARRRESTPTAPLYFLPIYFGDGLSVKCNVFASER